MEKRWLAFQLLCALRDCHAKEIYHGDIKTENVLVTSWNWLYLTDFTGSFKPAKLPDNNPATYSYFFDLSGRRTCYIAPERFVEQIQDPQELEGHNLTWSMDIFSKQELTVSRGRQQHCASGQLSTSYGVKCVTCKQKFTQLSAFDVEQRTNI